MIVNQRYLVGFIQSYYSIHVLLHSIEVLPLFILQLKFFFHYFCCIHDSIDNWSLRIRNPRCEVISMCMPIYHVTGSYNRDFVIGDNNRYHISNKLFFHINFTILLFLFNKLYHYQANSKAQTVEL